MSLHPIFFSASNCLRSPRFVLVLLSQNKRSNLKSAVVYFQEGGRSGHPEPSPSFPSPAFLANVLLDIQKHLFCILRRRQRPMVRIGYAGCANKIHSIFHNLHANRKEWVNSNYDKMHLPVLANCNLKKRCSIQQKTLCFVGFNFSSNPLVDVNHSRHEHVYCNTHICILTSVYWHTYIYLCLCLCLLHSYICLLIFMVR